ncbi:MAG: hypothetical protein HY880_05670 [Deltaproteobacteria bacterium]|nr:hypothetical protein [Deltaproteobacteria bacterium]
MTKGVWKLTERLYKDRLQKTGRLPTGKEQRDMEKKAKETAERIDRRKK